MARNKLLQVNDLSIAFKSKKDENIIYKNAMLEIYQGEVIGLLGPSGSGKSVLAKTIFNAALGHNCESSGSIQYFKSGNEQVQLFPAKTGRNHRIYGKEISMVFQEPALAFNPVLRVGHQIVEVVRKHQKIGKAKAMDLVKDRVERVGLSGSEHLDRYPHELSGGQLQRLMILMAIINEPRLLIADEPTTSLDSINQKQVLDLLKNLHREGMAILIITHDKKVLNYMNARPYEVLNRGLSLCEHLNENEVTVEKGAVSKDENVVRLRDMRVQFKELVAVNGISLELQKNEILGIVGPSGCGKSTLSKAICNLLPYSGTVDPNYPKGKVQMVFQHPGAALDPSQTIGDAVQEALRVSGLKARKNRRARAFELFGQVGLDTKFYDYYPHQVSGGMKQRACIARALATSPEILICDEAVSSLDAELKWKIARLLLSLAAEKGMSLIFISHDIELVNKLCHRVLVIDSGNLVEEFEPKDGYMPQSPTLQKLLEARLG